MKKSLRWPSAQASSSMLRRLSGQVPILRDILPRFSRVTVAPLK